MRWYVMQDGDARGPVTGQEVMAWVKAGTLGLSAHVREEESQHWMPLSESPFAPQKGASEVDASKDRLDRAWVILLYGAALIPFGSWLIVILSSVLFYAWRKDSPKKAQSMNRHGWLAFAFGNLLWGALWLLGMQSRPSTMSSNPPTISLPFAPPLNVYVRCEGVADGLACALEHKQGSVRAHACWDFVVVCANGSRPTAHACESADPGQTVQHLIPLSEFSPSAATCDQRVSSTVANVRVVPE